MAGTRAAGPARSTVAKARRLGELAKDPATNLRFALEHIDDPKNAVEPSAVAPRPSGFSGLEAFLRYPYTQSQAINLFDDRGYTLKLNILVNECTGYTTARGARANPGRTERCNSWLGPNQPGITTPDPSPATARSARRARARASDRAAAARAARQPAPTAGGSARSAAEGLLDYLLGA